MATARTERHGLLDALEIGIFLLAIALPGALLLLGKIQPAKAVDTEQRVLAPAPEWKWTADSVKNFPAAFEAYFSDRFGLRDALIRGHSVLTYFGLHASPSPKVVLGEGRWLFLKGIPAEDGEPLEDHRGTKPLNPYQLERWRWQLEDERDWVVKRNKTYLFGLVASKETLYPEKLPSAWRNIGLPTARQQFMEHMRRCLSFEFLDLAPPSLAAKSRALVYRLTDTHWNDEGCLVALDEVIKHLKPAYPQLPEVDRDRYNARDYRCLDGDLVRVIGLTHIAYEHFPEYRMRDSKVTATRLGESELSDIETTQPATNLPSLLFFHDSYGHFLKPFFPDYFSRTRFRWTNEGIEEDTLDRVNPDIVLHIMAERRLRLGQRYPVVVQQEGWSSRYAGADEKLTLDASALGQQLKPNHLTKVTDVTTGVVANSRSQVVFDLDLPLNAYLEVPILCIEVTTLVKTEFTMTWATRHEETWPELTSRTKKAFLEPGTSKVYFPIIDQEYAGHIQLYTDSMSRDLTIHNLTARSIPRYPPRGASSR